MSDFVKEDKISGPYFSITYDDELKGIEVTVFNVEEEEQEKTLKDAFDSLKDKYDDIKLDNNHIVFGNTLTDEEKFSIIDDLTDYAPVELNESVVTENPAKIEWKDLSGADQTAVGMAMDEIRAHKTEIEDAVRFACNEVANANYDTYGDSEGYEEPNYDKVLAFVQQELTLTELDEVTNPSAIPNIPGKHVNLNWKYKEDVDDRLELDEEITRYSDFVPKEDREYWYFTKHGVQPGSIPRGVNVLDIIDISSGSYVCLDAALNTSELKQYDLIEMAPDENEILGIENYYDTMFANQEFEDETRAFTSKLDRSTYESLQLKEDWTQEFDDYELDNILGGDRTVCPDCGSELVRDEFGSFCPYCSVEDGAVGSLDWQEAYDAYYESLELKDTDSMTNLLDIMNIQDELELTEDYLLESQAEDAFRTRFGDDLTDRLVALRKANKVKGSDADFGKYMKMSPEDIETAISNFEQEQTRGEKDREARKDAELVYSDDTWDVYYIKSFEASQKYGKGSKWCITGTDTSGNTDAYGNRYWDSYTGRGVKFYFYINKKDRDSSGREIKYALALEGPNNYSVWDMADHSVGEIPNGPNNITDEEGNALPNIGVTMETIDIDVSKGVLATVKQMKRILGSLDNYTYWTSSPAPDDQTAIAIDRETGQTGPELKQRKFRYCMVVPCERSLFDLGLQISDRIEFGSRAYVLGEHEILILGTRRCSFDEIQSDWSESFPYSNYTINIKARI